MIDFIYFFPKVPRQKTPRPLSCVSRWCVFVVQLAWHWKLNYLVFLSLWKFLSFVSKFRGKGSHSFYLTCLECILFWNRMWFFHLSLPAMKTWLSDFLSLWKWSSFVSIFQDKRIPVFILFALNVLFKIGCDFFG